MTRRVMIAALGVASIASYAQQQPKIGTTYKDSQGYWAPDVKHFVIRWTDRDAEHRSPGARRTELHELPRDGVVLTDACGVPHWAESSFGRNGHDHRVFDRLPRLRRAHAI